MGRCIAQVPNNDPDRLARIVNAKARCIGVDVNALQQQVNDKAAEKGQRQQEISHAQLLGSYDQQVTIKLQDAARTRREAALQEARYRTEEQGRTRTREWDLNRPDALLLDRPARQGDDDPRIGTSSLQVFAGEDLSAGSRTRMQMERQKSALRKQIGDHKDAAHREQEAARTEADRIRALDATQRKLFSEECAAWRHANEATRNTNAALAQHKAELADMEARFDSELVATELDSALTSPFLNEDPSTAEHALAPHRVRRDHWKGMSRDQLAAISEAQFQQLEALKAARQAERVENADWARQLLAVDVAVKEQERLNNEFRRVQANQRAAFLEQQKVAKNARERELAIVYRNEMSPAYFEQFGTSHR